MGNSSINFAELSAGGEDWIEIDKIDPSPFQPRSWFDPKKIEELEKSISSLGRLANPILVRRSGKGRFELIAGERRLRACQNLKLTHVNVLTLTVDDKAAAEIALASNLLQEPLNPIEQTQSILDLMGLRLNLTSEDVIRLLHRLQKNPHNVAGKDQLIIEEVCKIAGDLTWQSFYKHRLPLFNLPEFILEAIQSGKLPYTIGQLIGKVKDPMLQQELFKQAIAGDSYRDIQKQIKIHKNEETPTIQTKATEVLKKVKTIQDPEKLNRVNQLIDQLLQELNHE